MSIGARDLEFIETRLLAPCEGAMEAHERLKARGYVAEAEDLMTAMQTFTDACRQIRRDVKDWPERTREGGR